MRHASSWAIGLSTISVAAVLVCNTALPVGLALTAVAIPFGGWLLVLQEERRGHPVDVRVLVVAIGALLVLAVTLAPTGSHDLWSYVIYGRIAAQHHANPYVRLPRDFPGDPFLHLVGRGWRHTPSVYGPVFVAFATLGSAIAGGSTLAARLFHQAGAALAVAVALGLIWRRTRSAAALMLLGLNPLVIVTVVNGGHNDALVGLAVLGAVLLAEGRRPAAAGIALALGALIKVTALLALPALVVWVFCRHGRRAAARIGIAAIAAVLAGYAAVGPDGLRALDANHTLMSRASPWQIARALLHVRAHHSVAGVPAATWLGGFGIASILAVGALALLVAWRRRHDAELGAVVALTLTSYLVAGIYTLPWYVMWVLPAACLARHRATLVLVAGIGALLTAVYVVKARALPSPVGAGWWWLGAYIGPIIVLVAFVLVALRSPADPQPAPASTAPDPARRPQTRPVATAPGR